MSRTKRALLVVVVLLVILGSIGLVKALQIRKMMATAAASRPPPETITTARARREDWGETLSATGSLAAVQGVTVTAELPGKVVEIAFRPGATVRRGDLLLRQDTSEERAELRAAMARASLARTTLKRIRRLHARQVVAAAQLDEARSQAAAAAAEAAAIRATIQKKTLRAPFAGRLGIRLVNLGQVIESGTPIVSLQSIDPIYANFSVPQQQLPQLRAGLPVRLRTTVVGELQGKVTAINPQISASTRNVEVQATVSNADGRLRPGMFVEVTVVLPEERQVLAIPASAVLYAPYGASVFLVEHAGKRQEEERRPDDLVVRQQFVRLGERRGDYVEVRDGLREGQRIASSGVFKLRNGQPVRIDNALSPRFKLEPRPSES